MFVLRLLPRVDTWEDAIPAENALVCGNQVMSTFESSGDDDAVGRIAMKVRQEIGENANLAINRDLSQSLF